MPSHHRQNEEREIVNLTTCYPSRRSLAFGFMLAPIAVLASIPISLMLFHDAWGAVFSLLVVPLACFLLPLIVLTNSFDFDFNEATVTIRQRWFFIPSSKLRRIPFARIAELHWEPSLECGSLGDLVMRIEYDGEYLVTGNAEKAARIKAMIEQVS
ncbi:hypothetical protein GC197_09295 [bacterium]|nr:hypothetical protein [bacterium]